MKAARKARSKYAKQPDRRKTGHKTLRKIHGDYGVAVLARLDNIAPELKKWIIEFGFGEVYSRPALNPRSRQIATIAALVAMGHTGDELRSHIRAGLQTGLSRAEVVEVIMQMALYAGFPAAISGAKAAEVTFAELDASGHGK